MSIEMESTLDQPGSSPERDPRIDPRNGDILYRSDGPAHHAVRVCHGLNLVSVGDQEIGWVRYELPLRRNELKTVRIETWRTWASEAEPITQERLDQMLDHVAG